MTAFKSRILLLAAFYLIRRIHWGVKEDLWSKTLWSKKNLALKDIRDLTVMNPLKSSERLDMNPPFHNLEKASDDKDCIRTSICLIINNPWFGKALVIRVPSDDNFRLDGPVLVLLPISGLLCASNIRLIFPKSKSMHIKQSPPFSF